MIFRVKSWGREEREVCIVGALSLWGLWQSVALRARGQGPSRLWCWRSPEANRRCCSQGCSANMPTLWSWTPVKVAPNGIWVCMCCLISWLSSWWILCFPFENSSKEYTSSECLGWGEGWEDRGNSQAWPFLSVDSRTSNGSYLLLHGWLIHGQELPLPDFSAVYGKALKDRFTDE